MILLYFIINLIDTDSKRRESILASLNERFQDLIRNFKISEAYAKIVSAKPFKVLSSFVYDWTYVPLKRGNMDRSKPISPKPKSQSSGLSISIGKEKSVVRDLDEELEYPSHR